jgi:hypothetical protein
MITAKESGSPLNLSQILSLARDSGLQIPDTIVRLLLRQAW